MSKYLSKVSRREQGQGDIARDAVFVPTGELPMDDPVTVAGYDFNEGTDYDKLFE